MIAARLWLSKVADTVVRHCPACSSCACVRSLYLHLGRLQWSQLHSANHKPSFLITIRSLATTVKAKKLKDEGSAGLAEEGELDIATAASKAGPRQRSYIRKDNLKWHKSPWKVKQLRFSRHIANLVKKGKMAEAQQVFEHMKEGKIHPDVATFNVLIAGHGRLGDASTSFKLFNEVH